jgi:hypothetical protein
MKKLIFMMALILLAGITFGQVLPKGTVVGTHTLSITLQPGVTMEQCLEFLSSKYIPEFNKFDPDWQIYLVKSIRGNIDTNSIGIIHIIKSEEVRAKYRNPDGSLTELRNSRNEKLKPIQDELEKMGTFASEWTDWIVQ